MKSNVSDDMKLLLKCRDAAVVCGCSERMWRMWDMMGYTPQPIKINKTLFWRRKELESWVDAGCPKRELWHYENEN